MKTTLQTVDSCRLVRILRGTAYLFLGATVLSYAWLIGLGRWQLDEYLDFCLMRIGLTSLVERLTWSPRPVSEPIYYAYGWLVNYLHRPLIVPFLGILWAAFLLAGLFTFWQKRTHAGSAAAWPNLLVSLALMALFLTGGQTTEVFYWPAGAVAYMPTLAATLLLFLQMVDGKLATSRGRALAGVCMLVAAGSSEAGATFVLCYGVIQVAQWGVAALSGRATPTRRPVLWWAAPTALAVVVLFTVGLNRFTAMELPGVAKGPTFGHPVASLIVGFREMVSETAGREPLGLAMGIPHGSRLPMEILLAVGVSLCWFRFGRISKALGWRIVELVAALLLASLFTIAAANLHFGFNCCDRHQLLRQCWMVMSIAGLTMASSAWVTEKHVKWWARYSFLAPVVLCAAVVSLGHIRPLFQTYRMYAVLQNARNQNFQSGFREGETQMVFSVLPSAGIIWEEPLTPGVYAASPGRITRPGPVFYPDCILGFFDKQLLVIRRLKIVFPPTAVLDRAGDIRLP